MSLAKIFLNLSQRLSFISRKAAKRAKDSKKINREEAKMSLAKIFFKSLAKAQSAQRMIKNFAFLASWQ